VQCGVSRKVQCSEREVVRVWCVRKKERCVQESVQCRGVQRVQSAEKERSAVRQVRVQRGAAVAHVSERQKREMQERESRCGGARGAEV